MTRPLQLGGVREDGNEVLDTQPQTAVASAAPQATAGEGSWSSEVVQ